MRKVTIIAGLTAIAVAILGAEGAAAQEYYMRKVLHPIPTPPPLEIKCGEFQQRQTMPRPFINIGVSIPFKTPRPEAETLLRELCERELGHSPGVCSYVSAAGYYSSFRVHKGSSETIDPPANPRYYWAASCALAPAG